MVEIIKDFFSFSLLQLNIGKILSQCFHKKQSLFPIIAKNSTSAGNLIYFLKPNLRLVPLRLIFCYSIKKIV